MGIDKATSHNDLTSIAVALMFEGETLYHINEIKLNEPKPERLAGANERSLPKYNAHDKILILSDVPWEAQTSSAKSLLKNIVEKGLNLDFQQSTLFFPRSDTFSFEEIENLSYPVFAPGWIGRKVDGHSLLEGTNRIADGYSIIASPALDVLASDRNAKARLWKSMKQGFGL